MIKIYLRIVTDMNSRNILLYKPLETNKTKFPKSSYPESIKKIDLKIRKYQKFIDEANKLSKE